MSIETLQDLGGTDSKSTPEEEPAETSPVGGPLAVTVREGGGLGLRGLGFGGLGI